ncbi:MAG: hypothetical protein E7508_05790 [Ruminococcus sp.]|nr:hypothetical protein [Ruminococcus sp.]
MGLFSKLFGKKDDFSYIAEISSLISENNPDVMEKINLCIGHPAPYSVQNAERYGERGIEDVYDADNAEICWIGMVDELAENGYLFSADYKSEPEDILWGLSQLKSYHLIEKYVPDIDLTKIEDAEALAQEINLAVSGAFVCMIDIDSDSYELIIVTHEVYEKISVIAENNGHSIEIF